MAITSRHVWFSKILLDKGFLKGIWEWDLISLNVLSRILLWKCRLLLYFLSPEQMRIALIIGSSEHWEKLDVKCHMCSLSNKMNLDFKIRRNDTLLSNYESFKVSLIILLSEAMWLCTQSVDKTCSIFPCIKDKHTFPPLRMQRSYQIWNQLTFAHDLFISDRKVKKRLDISACPLL